MEIRATICGTSQVFKRVGKEVRWELSGSGYGVRVVFVRKSVDGKGTEFRCLHDRFWTRYFIVNVSLPIQYKIIWELLNA